MIVLEEAMISTENKIQIPSKGFIRVYWYDRPENYTKEGKSRVATYFSQKYDVDVRRINVVFRPVDRDGTTEIDVSDGVIDNIMDTAYQRKLFKAWLDSEGVEVDWDRMMRFDDTVNSLLQANKENDFRYKRWSIDKIELSNFLCYGEKNVIDFDKMKGMTFITSEPANQGGKTTLIDALLFLFFNTTTKTKKTSEIFNTYTKKNRVSVKGYIEIDGENYIIYRELNRKVKTTGPGFSYSTKLEYFKILADGTMENLQGEQRRETDEFIANTIGSQSDFQTTIVATANNLENLVETKPTERGKLLTRFIGLEVIEDKEAIAKEEMNKFKKRMKSNLYDVKQLEGEIKDKKIEIIKCEGEMKDNTKLLKKKKGEITEARKVKDDLLSSKQSVDDRIAKLNPDELQEDIDKLVVSGSEKRELFDELEGQIKTLSEVDYDDNDYKELLTEESDVNKSITKMETKLESKEDNIDKLLNSENCPTCGRALEDVDHSKEINNLKKECRGLKTKLKKSGKELEVLLKEKAVLETNKELSDKLIKLELKKDKTELDLKKLRIDVKTKGDDLKKYKKSLGIIEKNKEIDSTVLGYKYKIERLEGERDTLVNNIHDAKNCISNGAEEIAEKEKTIRSIKKEREVERIFEIYCSMVGKNGISKLVLRSVVPIINSELSRLLTDVCDFDVELFVNDKNEIEFHIIKDNIMKSLSSGSGLELTLASMALRTILGRISTLPKPSFIIMDEVLGKVANENLEYVKLFFDNIKHMFDNILFITHNPLAKDWADDIILIKKEKNISRIEQIK